MNYTRDDMLIIVHQNTKTLADTCSHNEHNKPKYMFIPVGQTMLHICPTCNTKTVIKGEDVIY